MTHENQVAPAGSRTVMQRSQQMAAALSSYARALTFENRSRRNLYRLAGLAPRLRDQIFAKLLVLAFIFCFAVPLSACVVYYLFFVTPQYGSEVRFVVRSSAPLLSRDRYSSSSIEPKAKIVQDTAVVLDYLSSPALVQDLKKSTDLNRLFSRKGIDYLSRLETNATQESLIKYWAGKYSSWVSPKSGIVELTIRAFSPEDAQDLARTVMNLAEARVNKLNAGMWHNLQVSAQNDVNSATKQLEDLRVKFRDVQNKTGVFDVSMSADSILSVLTTIEAEIATLKSQREAFSMSLSKDSPRLLELNRQIKAREAQVQNLREQTAGVSGGKDGKENLAEYSRVFDKLNLDIKMAENRVSSAIKELEKVKLVSSLQLVYLDKFTEPTLPDTSTYPNVTLSIFLSFLACVGIWGAVSGVIILLRRKMD